MNRNGLTRTAFEAQKSNAPESREEARRFEAPRPTLPSASTTIEKVEAIWAHNTNWIEL